MKHLILIFSLFIILSCKKEKENLIEKSKSERFSETMFPEVKNVEDIKNTDFVSTFESKLDKNQNTIYSVTLPFAWNEIKNEIKNEIRIPILTFKETL